jgi:CheY-like chemotaxis protein
MEFDEAEDEDPITLAETGIAATPPPTPAQTTLTALIVDDESVRPQERFLKQLGFEVTVLTSGIDAMAFFNDDKHPAINLVVMDYNMPGMTGLNATDSIRTAHPDLSALFFLYSTEDKETKRAALAAEFTNSIGIACKLFDGEIPKPCSKPQLEEVIRQRFDLIPRAKKK